MEFLEKNKVLIVQIVAGIVAALVLDWLDLPAWLIGAAVAAIVALWTRQLVETYDRHIAPRINDARRKD
ncbi:hypothetical protein DZK27_06635 [Rhodobacteraceae bacterium 63075]|nr:hypothetical protein DZK27_06635 [Rhodobacteraceae bacterium 63075]